jgi:hypothetical protein
VTVVIQLSGDDGYYGFAFAGEISEEIAKVGPYQDMQICLRSLGVRVRDAGYWNEAKR